MAALARGLIAVGRLAPARDLVASMREANLREESLVRLARALTEAGRISEALSILPPQDLDRYVRTTAELAVLIDRSEPGEGIAALREVTRITGWIRDDWRALHDTLGSIGSVSGPTAVL